MDYEWDNAKAKANLLKHGVDFADAAVALEDDLALTKEDHFSEGEDRYICVSMGPYQKILVTIFTYREDRIRIISSRPATGFEQRQYENF